MLSITLKFIDSLILAFMSWGFPRSIEEVPINTSEAPQLPQDEPLLVTPPHMTNAEKLYQTAVQSIGRDMSPLDRAPDSLGCMESLDGVWFTAFGEHLLNSTDRLSTERGYKAMLTDKRLKKVTNPVAGCIVISPTGFAVGNASRHGHVGVVGNHDIMSNDSNSGLWKDNYTKEAWIKVFHDTLSFPIYYFLPLDA